MSIGPDPGIYRLQFGLEFSADANLPKPEALFLTNHGDGKQLTLEPSTIGLNQDVNYQYYILLNLSADMFLRCSGTSGCR